MSNDTSTHAENVKAIADAIKGIKFAMLTTTTEGGLLHSRPMTTQEQEFDGDLWFLGGKDSGSVADIKAHDSVNVSYSDADKGTYVSLAGKAQLVEDRAKLEELWSDAYKAYYDGGIDDPNIQLIKVNAEGAEFWEGGKAKNLFQMAKAALGGKTSDDHGKNETVKL